MRRLVLLVSIVPGLALAACTPGTAPEDTATAGSTAPSSTPAPASSSTPRSTPPAAPSSVPVTSVPSSPEQVTVRTAATVAPRSTCRSVTVRVIRGSADRGREFAALQFTNTGTTRCTLAGYPTVTLRLRGRAIGTASQPGSPAASSYALAPGDTAESRLDDYTDCQAPLSDAIHVVVPGSTQNATRPGQLRACTLRVSRLGRPD